MSAVPRYAVMWSGGKDSALALVRAREQGFEIGCLINVIDAATGRVRFHATRAELIAAQAEALGVPLRQLATSWPEFEATLRAALAGIAAEGYAGVILGDIHLADVRAWYEERVHAAGLEHVEPLWGDAPLALVREYATRGGRAVITCCEVARLDERWLGRVIDTASVEELVREPIDPCGENGEYHSFAFAGPPFAAAVGWVAGARHLESGFVQLELLSPREAVLASARETVAADEELAAAVRARTAGAWGRLAGLAVIAHRERLGRRLNDAERRAVWDAVWHEVHGDVDERYHRPTPS